MISRYVIALNQPSPEIRQHVATFIKAEGERSGVMWWYWFQDVWLLRDNVSRSPQWWRDEISRIANVEVLVLRLGYKPGDWAGFMAGAGGEWLRNKF